VGDARFVLRCEKRLEELHRTGTTLLLVSHNVQAVRKTCRLALWLDRGRVQAAGPVEEVVDRYVAFSAGG
jgi:ABC-type polysaccharide/polyol phosphate transport system ATPase subunit